MLREIYYAFIHSHVLYGAEIIRILSLRMAVMHLPTKFCTNSFLQFEVRHFLKSKTAAATILDFQVVYMLIVWCLSSI